MCGVPVERADEYLHRLIALGHRVAVCEQLEDPAEARKRGAKSVVRARRGAPGHARHADRRHAARRQAQQLPAGHRARPRCPRSAKRRALRSPGSTFPPANSASPSASRSALAAEIARLEPGEIIVSDALYGDPELARFWRELPAVTPLTRDVFDGATAERRLTVVFRGRHQRGLRRAVAAGADRGGGLRHLCRAHPARQAAAAVAAVARGGRRDAGDRPGDARQSRTDADARPASGAARCSTPSTAPSRRPARACWRSGWRRR